MTWSPSRNKALTYLLLTYLFTFLLTYLITYLLTLLLDQLKTSIFSWQMYSYGSCSSKYMFNLSMSFRNECMRATTCWVIQKVARFSKGCSASHSELITRHALAKWKDGIEIGGTQCSNIIMYVDRYCRSLTPYPS